MKRPGRLVVLSGPSGVGKSTIVKTLRAQPNLWPNLWLSVSATTRPIRPGEIDGLHYFFWQEREFQEAIQKGTFLEWADFAGYRYGTPVAPVKEHLAEGQDVLLEIDLQGARQIKASDKSALTVFLAPPSFDELVRRLTGRGTESEEVIQRRLELAEAEMAAISEFDHVVVNSEVEKVVATLVALAHT